jgi:hypothetical protein
MFKIIKLFFVFNLLICLTGCFKTTTSTIPFQTINSDYYDSDIYNNNALPHVYKKDFKMVFEGVLASLKELRWRIKEFDEQKGEIWASTPFSIWTFGDNVYIQVKQLLDDDVSVDITSSSSQLFDWGKNSKNIVRFYRKLDCLLQN